MGKLSKKNNYNFKKRLINKRRNYKGGGNNNNLNNNTLMNIAIATQKPPQTLPGSQLPTPPPSSPTPPPPSPTPPPSSPTPPPSSPTPPPPSPTMPRRQLQKRTKRKLPTIPGSSQNNHDIYSIPSKQPIVPPQLPPRSYNKTKRRRNLSNRVGNTVTRGWGKFKKSFTNEKGMGKQGTKLLGRLRKSSLKTTGKVLGGLAKGSTKVVRFANSKVRPDKAFINILDYNFNGNAGDIQQKEDELHRQILRFCGNPDEITVFFVRNYDDNNQDSVLNTPKVYFDNERQYALKLLVSNNFDIDVDQHDNYGIVVRVAQKDKKRFVNFELSSRDELDDKQTILVSKSGGINSKIKTLLEENENNVQYKRFQINFKSIRED